MSLFLGDTCKRIWGEAPQVIQVIQEDDRAIDRASYCGKMLTVGESGDAYMSVHCTILST